MDATDRDLVSQFVREKSETAFHELVRRHLAMVLATARRAVTDSQQAEEVAQSVFLLLASKAPELGDHQSIAGWLYQSAHRCALNARRSENRRQQREQIAAAMQTHILEPSREQLVEELERALSDLPTDDRDALVIRFLEDRQLREVGRELGVSEEAARKRVGRALERLRENFARRGITASAGTITLMLAGEAGATVPIGLITAITKTALAGSTVAASVTTTVVQQGTIAAMKTIHLKIVATVAATVLATGTSFHFLQQRATNRLLADIQGLERMRDGNLAEQQRLAAALSAREAELEQLRKDASAVHRLRAEVDRLSRELGNMAQHVQGGEPSPAAIPAPTGAVVAPEPVAEDWLQSVARIRAKLFGGGLPTDEEVQWLQDAKPLIEQLERDPAQFAAFQSELIKSTVPTLDAQRLGEIGEIIRQTYAVAVAQGLDLPSKPNPIAEVWVARRHELDRLATEAVQALLNASEREQFDRRFLGIMGVDLGTGVDPTNYPLGFFGDPPSTGP
jgi:RNA polymerase sigma factor (sigma-70 family)